jgi:hypothetical protein
MTDLDPVEDGQAECRFCGEWYHVGLLALGHTCAAKRKHDEVVRFTRPEATARRQAGRAGVLR